MTRSKNYLDSDLDCNQDYNVDRHPEDVPVYRGHPLFNTTMCFTLLFIVQSLLHCNPPDIWIKIIQNANQVKYLHGTKVLNSDHYLGCNLDNFAPCEWSFYFVIVYLQY